MPERACRSCKVKTPGVIAHGRSSHAADATSAGCRWPFDVVQFQIVPMLVIALRLDMPRPAEQFEREAAQVLQGISRPRLNIEDTMKLSIEAELVPIFVKDPGHH